MTEVTKMEQDKQDEGGKPAIPYTTAATIVEPEKNGGAAARKVFETMELLEAILLQVLIKDLLLSTRVCATWKSTIDGSAKLQRGLFFQPAGEPVEIEDFEGGKGSRLRTEYRASIKAAFVNPLLKGKFGPAYIQYYMPVPEPTLPSHVWHAQASWRRMLSIQPPLQPLVKQDSKDLYRTHLKQLPYRLKTCAFLNLAKAMDCADVCNVAGDIEEMRSNDGYHNKGFSFRFEG